MQLPQNCGVEEGGIPVKDECAPYLGLWVNSLVGSSIFEIDLFLILPNAPHTRVREGVDCASNYYELPQIFSLSSQIMQFQLG